MKTRRFQCKRSGQQSAAPGSKQLKTSNRRATTTSSRNRDYPFQTAGSLIAAESRTEANPEANPTYLTREDIPGIVQQIVGAFQQPLQPIPGVPASTATTTTTPTTRLAVTTNDGTPAVTTSSTMTVAATTTTVPAQFTSSAAATYFPGIYKNIIVQ